MLCRYVILSRFAPIYETASTRKFFHGRTETVRGLTREMKEFGEAVMEGREVQLADYSLEHLIGSEYRHNCDLRK